MRRPPPVGAFVAEVEIEERILEAAGWNHDVIIANQLGRALRRRLRGPEWHRSVVSLFHLIALAAHHERLVRHTSQPDYDRDLADQMVAFEEWLVTGFQRRFVEGA